MNLYRLATEGIDLDALPLEESQQPRASFQFEPSTRTPDRIQAPGELDDVFNFAAQEYGVDVDVLRGIAYAESRFNPDIISGKVKSPAGAIGLMQFMPETAKEYGIDPTDPVQAIIGGAAYLRKSLDKFDGDYERAVASYNWGPNRKAYDSEDWASKAPAETQKYLMTVFDAAGRFKDGANEQTAITRPETQATPLPAGVAPSAAGGGRGFVSPGDINTKLTRTAVPEMTAGSVARDIASGVLQIAPTFVQGVGDVIGLASGNRLGGSVREFAKEGKQAIQQVVGSERAQAQAQNFAADMADDSVSLGQAIANNKGALADQLLPAVGSMLLPIGAAGAAGKLATVGKTAQGLSKAALAARVASAQQAAGIGATAAQNAASTFAELVDKGVSLPDAYAAAGITVPFSVIAGKLTGGGVEGALVRGATNPASIAKGAGELLLKAPLREGAQEGGEALGQVAGEVLGADQDVSLQSAIKRVGTEALLGGVMGGGFNAVQQLAAPTVEAQPTTPQAPTVTPQAPAAPDAAKTQAVDNIAAAIQEMEGAATQTAPVQPGSPAADAGAAPVAQGAADTSGGLATDGEAVAAGQPEQAGALTEAQPVATAQAVDQAQPVSPYQDLGEELAAIKARSQPAPQAETLPPAQEQAAPVQAQPATSVLAAEMAQMKSRNQATTAVDPAKPAPIGIGQNNTPLAEGGKPFKTKAEADTARKLQPMMRVKKQGKGFVLVEKTPAQIAAQEIAARRNLGGVGSGGGPLSAHAFLASMGGLNKSTMADLGFDRNVRVGSKWLFTNTGMTMERMTEALQQSGYVQGTEQKPAIDLVSKSAKGQPQYTAEGWDQIAQAEATARFEDHLAAQQEAAMADEDFDPFVPGAIGEDFSRDDFAMAGYDTASPEDSSEFAAMLAAAQAEGIDTEAILERAAQQTQSGTYEDYRNQVRALIGAARGERVAVVEGAGSQQGREDAQRKGAGDDRAGTGREGASGVDGEGLTAYTPAEVTARQDAAAEAEATAKRAEDAAARAEAAAKQASEIAQRSVAAADTFELGQSAEDNLSGQEGFKFSRKDAGVSVGFKPGTQFLQATSDAGTVGGTVKDGVLRITFAEVDEAQRGQGNGLKLYKALIDRALDDGLKVTSDFTVEADAVRVYEALGRRGYTVTRLDGGVTDDGAAYGRGAKEPAFEVSRSDDVRRSKTNKPIAILDGTEVAAEITHDNAVEVAREWYRANLQGDTVTRNGFGEVRFTSKGWGELKLGLRNDALKAKLLPSIRALIKSGEYHGKEPLYKQRSDSITAFHFFSGKVSVDGKVVTAGVTVGEDAFGNLFYNVTHNESRFWKDRSPLVLPREKAEGPKGLQANSEPSTRRSVSDDDGNVNLVILDGAPTGTPTTTIREAITKAYGNLLPRLESKGLVYLTQTEEDAIADAAQARAAKIGGDVEAIKQALRKAVVAQVGDSSIDVKYSQDGHLEGFFDPEIGRAYLIADGLTEQSAPGTLMHEVGIHMAADGKLQPMFERAAKLIRLGRNNPFLRRVQARLDAAGETSAEEAAAYLVTEYENSRLSAPPSVVLWVQDFIADIRAWLFSKGVLLKTDQLTMADVVAVARANARRLSMQAVDAQAGGAYTQPDEDNQPTADDKDRVAKLSAAVARFFNISEPASGPAYRAVQLPDAADLQSIGSAFGKRVVGFGLNPVLAGSKSPFSTAGGVSLPSMPDTVFINASSDRPHLSVLGHELAHTLRRENPALFDEMVEAIRPYIKQTEYGYEFTKERVARDLRKPDAIREEFVGEVLSDGFTQSAFWEALGRKSPSTLARVMDAVVNLIGKARRAFSPQRRTEKYLTDFDRVMEIAGEVMAKYSPDSEASIRRSVGGGQQQAVTTWDDLGDSKMDALIYEGQDDRIDLKRVQENIVKAGRQIREEFDARMAETLFPGRVAKRNESFVDQEVKPLLQAMAASNVSMEELGDYLLARHAPERNEQIAKVNPDMPDGGAGTNSQGVLMTTQAANDYIANLSPGKRIAMQLLAKRVDAITKGTREILVAEGLEKASTVAAWEGAYKNYVPLFKDEAAETPGHPVGSGFSVKGGASKRAMGSTKEVTNVLAHVLMQREAAITRAEKNRVGMSLYGLALSNPNKEFWATVRPVGMTRKQLRLDLMSMGIDPELAMLESMVPEPTKRIIARSEGVDTYTNPIDGMQQVSAEIVKEVIDRYYKQAPNALVVKVNGEDRVILFNKSNDRAMRLVESLKNQNRGSGVFVDGANLVAPVTRFMASMLTQYNPAFGMVNAVRDVQGALVNLSSTELKGKQSRVLADVPAAMKGIARDLRGDKARTQWSDLWVQFQDDGGRTGIRDLISDPYEKAGQVEKDLKRLSKEGKLTPGNAAHAVLDLLSDFNDTLENGVRLAAYKAAIDQGMSRPAAAKLARELTVDFNRKGRTGRELGKLYAFLNASIQGSARTIQTLKGPMGAKIMAGGFALGVLQAFMLAAAGFDDDDIPEFIKSRNLIIPMGGDRYVTIPMALGLHVLPNTGRAVTELIMSGGKDIGEKSLNTIVEIVTAFNPFGGGGDWKTAHGPLTMITPTVMDPVIDLAMNRDFTGRQISKERRPSGDVRPGATMARESTKQSPSGQVYISISEAINAATGGTDVTKGALSPTPEELRYLATVVGGGVYRETERAINAAALLARGEEVKPHQVPLGSRFAGEVDDEMSTMGRYYKNDEKLNAFWAEFKAEAKDGNTERVEAMKRDPMFAAAAMNSKIEQYITKINKLAGENVGDKEKYEALNKKRAELMKKVNDAVKEAEKQ